MTGSQFYASCLRTPHVKIPGFWFRGRINITLNAGSSRDTDRRGSYEPGSLKQCPASCDPTARKWHRQRWASLVRLKARVGSLQWTEQVCWFRQSKIICGTEIILSSC